MLEGHKIVPVVVIKTLEDNEKISLVNSFIMSLMTFITNVDDE